MTAFTDPYALLRRLVTLKRQKAEQILRAAEEAAAKTHLSLDLLDLSLDQLAAPDNGDEDGLRLLALQHRHDYHLLARRSAARTQLGLETDACELARRCLRRAVLSEEQLGKTD